MAKGEIFGVEFGTGPQRPGDLAKDQSEHLGHAIQNKGQCRESPEINQNPGFWKRQVWAGGLRMKGLIRRRQAEADRYAAQVF